MDGDIGTMLQAVLSDPAQMAKLTEAAQGLFGGAPQETAPDKEPVRQDAPAFSGDETRILSALGKTLGGNAGSGRSTALLMAMRPYMKPEKKEKLDRAMKLSHSSPAQKKRRLSPSSAVGGTEASLQRENVMSFSSNA